MHYSLSSRLSYVFRVLLLFKTAYMSHTMERNLIILSYEARRDV
jgi:hypothetical protein